MENSIKLLLFSSATYLIIILIFYTNKKKTINKYMNFINILNDSLTYLINRDYQKLNKLRTLDETFDSKVNQKILRLSKIWQEESLQGLKEKKNLQSLISDVSHQVKTPITNLKMLQLALGNDKVSKKDKEKLLKSMDGQLDKIHFLLDSMIKSSRLETGLIQLKKIQLNLFDTIAEAISGITVNAEKKGIEIIVDCPEKYILSHDKKWTAEALFNVLENAIKYSPENTRIEVKVQKWKMYTKIDIIDEGIGIHEKDFGKVFQRFFRQESSYDKEGVGIGLYLSREIIQKQDGYIKVASIVGEGSTFSVFLPNDF
ncbi:two-component system signal transduction histidine kinase [Gottschalkia acidurici 9a]|uniref:histidine kinase n=1 Tax=Gottschalkia acidurici (strain ATCC 7906 / DSM 604 / BCRC 14475 / CIP 104303 / KCTC 5404 / NCIMB 10678 / 9a) TaxID=1128398 RepID=K0AXS8_GOTA9|nr:HAMP domain-containing sensor histidine kinase [Gottschalkia acidurici]AFS77545.1 two-component system signal transduction histidine kinase [Gottschalkia acidurici 9a]